MVFKVEIRKTCKICGNKLPKRFRTFCSTKCRQKSQNSKYSEYRTEWHRKRRDENASNPSPRKIKCLVCGKWYIQVCTHIVQVHKMTAREYKKEYGLDVKRGRVPKWYREMKADIAYGNGTIRNLAKGEEYWFKKDDKRAGRYERSEETMARLKKLHNYNKKYAKTNRL